MIELKKIIITANVKIFNLAESVDNKFRRKRIQELNINIHNINQLINKRETNNQEMFKTKYTA